MCYIERAKMNSVRRNMDYEEENDKICWTSKGPNTNEFIVNFNDKGDKHLIF